MHEALRPWVAEIGMVPEMGPGVHVREPEPGVLLGFRPGYAFVMGPRTHASYLGQKDVPDCLVVLLRPGRARPLLGVALRELADRVAPLRELWGPAADGLADELLALPARQRCARLAEVLLARLAERPPAELARAELLQHATDLVMRERVPAVARRLGLSERGLRDLFAAGVGVSPKRFAGLRRVRALMAADGPLADRASALGYYDQSHMTAEFRAVMGVPPGAFLAGVRPEPEYC